MKTSILFSTILTTLLLGASSASFASDATDSAKNHFQAIGAGDVGIVMRGYGDNSQLTWVGGPLDGSYSGSEKIRTVWEKLAKAQGALKASVDKLEESANPKGSTITANVQFEGKQTIKVRYVLTYRDNKLVNEVWQIDPKLGAASY